MAVNPYLVGGLSEGVERGLGIYQSFDQMRRQKELDAQALDDRAAERELRGLRVQQAQQGLEQGNIQLEQARRQQALQGTVEEQRAAMAAQAQQEQALQQAKLQTEQAKAQRYRAQVQADLARARKEAAVAGTEEEKRRFTSAYLPMAAWQNAPEEDRNAVIKVGAVVNERLDPAALQPQDLSTALNVVLQPEMQERVGNTYSVSDLKKRGYTLPRMLEELATRNTVKGTVVDVGNPQVRFDPERRRFLVTTDQVVEFDINGRKVREVLRGAPSTRGGGADDGAELGEFTFEELRQRFNTMAGLPSIYRQLEQQGIPVNMIPQYVASQAAALDVKPPQGIGITPPPVLTPSEKLADARARKTEEELRQLQEAPDFLIGGTAGGTGGGTIIDWNDLD